MLPFTGKVATQGELDYAHFADRTPHVVLSSTLRQVAWKTARIEHDLDALLRLKQQPGMDIYVVGGAALVVSLMNKDWIDELRLTVHPVVLGQGKALFDALSQRQRLTLVEARPLKAGLVSMIYTTRLRVPMMSKIEVENVLRPGSTYTVDAAKYEAMKRAYFAVLPRAPPGWTVAEVGSRLLPHLPEDLFPGGAKAGWWAKAVQLDLEAKGVVARTDGRPLRLYRVAR